MARDNRPRAIRGFCLGVLASVLVLGFGAASADAAAPGWLPIAAAGPTNLPPQTSEIQKVAVDAEAGTFTLSFESQTTGPVAFDATPAEVADALNGLGSIGGAGGSVAVSGGPGGVGAAQPYFVSFGEGLAGLDVAQLAADASALSGGAHSAVATTQTQGGTPGTGEIAIFAQNVGGAPSAGTVTITDELPISLALQAVPLPAGCASVVNSGITTVTCETGESAGPGLVLKPVILKVKVVSAFPTALTNKIVVSGGGATGPGVFEQPLTISEDPAEPGFQSFTAGAYGGEGELSTRAASHPDVGTGAVLLNTRLSPSGEITPAGDLKTARGELPPGFLGNPTATPRCPEGVKDSACPISSQVGTVQIVLKQYGGLPPTERLHAVEAPFGYPAKFTFESAGVLQINVVGSVRSDGDYGLNVESPNTPQVFGVLGFFFNLWGDPANSVHDAQRGGPSTGPHTAFLTQASDCALQAEQHALDGGPFVGTAVDTWLTADEFQESKYPVPPVTGCDDPELQEAFEATKFTFQPAQTSATTPSEMHVDLTIPEGGLTDPDKLAAPPIRTSVITFPQGVSINPSSADGLATCSLSQIGYKGNAFAAPNRIRFNKESPHCPDASKIGTVEVHTKLLDNPLPGTLYLAAQNENPFGTDFAVYLVVDDPSVGVVIKLPGKVEADPNTGQLKTTFDDLPQLAFGELKLELKGGDRAPLATPDVCGTASTVGQFTPWSAPESGPDTFTSDSFQIETGSGGSACANTPASRPFDLGFKAGSQSSAAGATGPFDFQVTRPDPSQELSTLKLTAPPGVSASLKGIPSCTAAPIPQIETSTGKAELEHPACPAASQVGTLRTGAGAGPSPFYVSGKLYLAGPYKNAPLSVLAVTPAVAGPFDLGNVVVRTALNVNRTNAQVSATSDPIPQFLDGVQLRIRDVRIHLSRDKWTINPTSCEPMSVALHATASSGALADKSARFQVGGCSDLAFKPKLSAKVTGPTKRGGLPAFTAELTYPEGPGYANIKDVQVALPHSEFLEQSHINTICTRVQAAANACPKGSIYGYAEAETPLLDGKLSGPVFLKSSDHQLPDLAIALRGPDAQPIEVEFQGRIDSVKAQIRNTIEGLPDVPVSKFVLRMKGGNKGLLVNSRNLCLGKPGRMTVHMIAQNNRRADTRPLLGNSCGKKSTGKHKKSKKHSRPARLSRLIATW